MKDIFFLAKKALDHHQVIAFPTETVFGLGVYFDDYQAYLKMNEIKRRKENKPYTMMLGNVDQINQYAIVDKKYWPIIQTFMPGPLTILAKSKDNVPSFVTHNSGIIGIRIPSHPQALELLNYLQKPLLVPSANRADGTPAINETDVKQIFNDEVEVIVPGKCEGGIASTIISLLDDQIKIIREGPISLESINQTLE